MTANRKVELSAQMARAVFLFLVTSPILFCADTVLLIINENSPLSREIGQYYAGRRKVPAAHVCKIRTSVSETTDRDSYLKQIEQPVAECLRSRGLVEKILYLLTTAGVPLRVRGTSGPVGSNASVDSELTLLYSKIHRRPFPIDGIVPNPFFGKKEAVFRHPDFPIYLVTRLAGYDAVRVRALVDRSLAAKNTGKFVIDSRSDDEESADRWLKDAALALPAERTIFDASTKVLYGQKEVIAYASWGSNDKQHTRRRLGFQWLPGAITTEFVSTNGRTFERPPANWNIGTDWTHKENWFAGSPQTLLSDYLEEGATGGSGHVDEPYLGFTPRPDYLLPAYYSGRNLAESFYLSIPGLSWQNIVVGDPLCTLGSPR